MVMSDDVQVDVAANIRAMDPVKAIVGLVVRFQERPLMSARDFEDLEMYAKLIVDEVLYPRQYAPVIASIEDEYGVEITDG